MQSHLQRWCCANSCTQVLQVESEERARRMQLELTLERTKRDADQEMHRCGFCGCFKGYTLLMFRPVL